MMFTKNTQFGEEKKMWLKVNVKEAGFNGSNYFRTDNNLSPHPRNPVSRGGTQSHTQGSALLRLADC
jgi:hypothetical protein